MQLNLCAVPYDTDAIEQRSRDETCGRYEYAAMRIMLDILKDVRFTASDDLFRLYCDEYRIGANIETEATMAALNLNGGARPGPNNDRRLFCTWPIVLQGSDEFAKLKAIYKSKLEAYFYKSLSYKLTAILNNTTFGKCNGYAVPMHILDSINRMLDMYDNSNGDASSKLSTLYSYIECVRLELLNTPSGNNQPGELVDESIVSRLRNMIEDCVGYMSTFGDNTMIRRTCELLEILVQLNAPVYCDRSKVPMLWYEYLFPLAYNELCNSNNYRPQINRMLKNLYEVPISALRQYKNFSNISLDAAAAMLPGGKRYASAIPSLRGKYGTARYNPYSDSLKLLLCQQCVLLLSWTRPENVGRSA